MECLNKLSKVLRSPSFGPRQISLMVFLLCGLIEVTALARGVFLGRFNDGRFAIVPTVQPPFVSLNLDLGPVGPIAPKPPLERLLEAAHRLTIRTAVPYVFGGSQLGPVKICHKCSECIRQRRLPADSSMERVNQCIACRSCGIDCSNFVRHLFSEAGLKVKFATTATLNRESQKSLDRDYGFINVGDDLQDARPGDLVLKKGHVIVLLDIHHQLGTLDFIHASRGSKRTPVGGIELRRGYSLRKIQRDAIRILRHRDLMEPTDSGIRLSSVHRLLSDLRRLMAAI